MAERRYSDSEVRDILKRAIEMDVEPNGFTHDQLVDLADELDISRQALEQAERLWTAERPPSGVREIPVAPPEARVERRAPQEASDFHFPFGKLIFFFILMSIFGGWSSGWLVPLFVFGLLFAAGRSGGRHHAGGWSCGPQRRQRSGSDENWL